MESRRILFVCPDIQKPSGGIKQIYRQVDILSENGFNAFILHESAGFRCQWFKNKTPILYNSELFTNLKKLKPRRNLTLLQKIKTTIKNALISIRKSRQKIKDIQIDKKDILVFPEVYGPRLAELMPGVKKVIYNQGAYQTFFGYDLDLKNKQTPYFSDDLISVLVNSKDAKEYMNLAFPNLNVFRVKYGFDHSKFNSTSAKKLQICFMPRRLRSDIVQVVNILKFKGILKNWEVKPIENMNEKQVAQCMKESAVFLSFNINEGFGMPPAEAMACGCIVVGYPGQGGKEIFNSDFSYPVKDRDIKAYVKILEKVLLDYEEHTQLFKEKATKASKFILSEYSLEEEKQSILNAWNQILKLS